MLRFRAFWGRFVFDFGSPQSIQKRRAKHGAGSASLHRPRLTPLAMDPEAGAAAPPPPQNQAKQKQVRPECAIAGPVTLISSCASFFFHFSFCFFDFCCVAQKASWRSVLLLAYQSLGVVYGDLSTSPLYVYKSAFAEDIQHSATNEEIFGVLSFVFWTLTLVPLLKYVFIVLRADDNGEGGTFALYSLLCRHARVNFLPSRQVADEELSDYKKDGAGSSPKTSFGSRLKSTLERRRVLQRLLLILALIGTCMVIGDGVLTPSISGSESDCLIVPSKSRIFFEVFGRFTFSSKSAVDLIGADWSNFMGDLVKFEEISFSPF